MSSYVSEVKTNKQFTGNVVVLLGGVYYSSRKPDSGLAVSYPNSNAVSGFVLNPTSVSPKIVTTTISSYSFKLLDKDGAISRHVKDTGQGVVGTDVRIWLGRSDASMDFSEYYELPTTKLANFVKVDGGYTFSVREATDRMNRPIYDNSVRLNGDILSGTTVIIAKDDIAKFPSSGMFRIENELISYTSKNDGTKTFSGCGRGEFGTIAAAHEDNLAMLQAQTVSANPLDLILQLLTSGSGSGAYDVLDDGLSISPSLIDVSGIESLRDALFSGVVFDLAFYNIENALKYIEQQLLAPCNLRFTYSSASKITLVKLDRAEFIDSLDVINHDTLIKTPQLEVKDSNVVNKITIDYNFDEGTQKYLSTAVFEDEDSQATYGKSTSPLAFRFKGISDDAFIDSFGTALLERLANPYPEIKVSTQMDKSLLNVGNKTRLETDTLADEYGTMNFAYDLEIVNRAINWQTGDVQFTLAYTSFTGRRLCYIAPSDSIAAVTDQSTVDLAAGRGDFWQVGWKVRLWNTVTRSFESDPVNEIAAITDDEITFTTPWVTTLTTNHMLKFSDYDQATTEQRRYCFIGINDQNFSRTGKQYTIVP